MMQCLRLQADLGKLTRPRLGRLLCAPQTTPLLDDGSARFPTRLFASLCSFAPLYASAYTHARAASHARQGCMGPLGILRAACVDHLERVVCAAS